MTTGFTDEQIRQLEEDFINFLPPEPSFADVEHAPKVERLAFAGTEIGMLPHVDTGSTGKRNLFLNPIVARTLMEGIGEAGATHKWWAKLENKQIPLAPDLTRTDLETAEDMRSLPTANVPEGLLAVCGGERGTISFFMGPDFAAAIAWSVDEIGKRACWWDPDYDVIPSKESLS